MNYLWAIFTQDGNRKSEAILTELNKLSVPPGGMMLVTLNGNGQANPLLEEIRSKRETAFALVDWTPRLSQSNHSFTLGNKAFKPTLTDHPRLVQRLTMNEPWVLAAKYALVVGERCDPASAAKQIRNDFLTHCLERTSCGCLPWGEARKHLRRLRQHRPRPSVMGICTIE